MDQESRNKQIDKTLTALRRLNTKLNKYKLKRLPAINKAVKEILMAHDTQKYFSISIHKHVAAVKFFRKRGRPTANSPIKIARRIEYQLSWEINQMEVIRHLGNLGCINYNF